MQNSSSDNVILDPLRLIYYIHNDGKNMLIQNSVKEDITKTDISMQYEKPLMDISSIDILNKFYSIYNKNEWIDLCNKLNLKRQHFYTIKRLIICGVDAFWGIITDKDKKQLDKILGSSNKINFNQPKDNILRELSNINIKR